MTDLTNKHGVTAQILAAGGAVANSSAIQAHGTAVPEHTPGRAGWYTAGRPFGNSAGVLVPGDGGGNQVQLVASPAGTSGGDAAYPNVSGRNAVQNPLVVPNWDAQRSPGGSQQLVITSASQLPSGTHTVVYGGATLAATGGLGARTWALANGSSLPAGLSLSAAGLISGTPTTAGSYTFTVRLTDVSGNVGAKLFSLAVS
jgi:hypothetical protein